MLRDLISTRPNIEILGIVTSLLASKQSYSLEWKKLSSPRILREGSNWRRVSPLEADGRVGESLLRFPEREAFSQEVEERLGNEEDERIGIPWKLKKNQMEISSGFLDDGEVWEIEKSLGVNLPEDDRTRMSSRMTMTWLRGCWIRFQDPLLASRVDPIQALFSLSIFNGYRATVQAAEANFLKRNSNNQDPWDQSKKVTTKRQSWPTRQLELYRGSLWHQWPGALSWGLVMTKVRST